MVTRPKGEPPSNTFPGYKNPSPLSSSLLFPSHTLLVYPFQENKSQKKNCVCIFYFLATAPTPPEAKENRGLATIPTGCRGKF